MPAISNYVRTIYANLAERNCRSYAENYSDSLVFKSPPSFVIFSDIIPSRWQAIPDIDYPRGAFQSI